MHFDIHLDRKNEGNNKVLLDGKDISKQILVDGFGVSLNEARQPIVSLRLRPDSVDIDGSIFVTEAPPADSAQGGGQ